MAIHLGIDFGTKRCGFAICDPGETIATPLKVIEYQSQKKLIREIVEICEERRVESFVLGLPINMDGTEGDSVKKVRAFAAALEKSIKLPIHYIDERLTSEQAHDVLIMAGVKGPKRKHIVDKLAAQIILQEYLDRQ